MTTNLLRDTIGFEPRGPLARGQATGVGLARLIWLVFLGLSVALTLETFRHLRHDWFEVILFARISLVALASLAVLWLVGERPLLRPAQAAFLLSHGGTLALFALMAHSSSHLLSLLIAGLFVLSSFLFRGRSSLWWGLFAPLGILFTSAPLYVFSASGGGLSRLMTLGKWPAVFIAFACVVSVLRETRARSLSARSIAADVSDRNNALLKDLREFKEKLERAQALETADASAPIEAQMPVAVESAPAAAVPETFQSSVAAQAAGPIPEGVGYQDVCHVIEATADGERALPGAAQKIRFALAGVDESHSPALISVELEELKSIVGSLVRHAVDSIGGGAGIVRIALRVSQTALHLTVEDNGRGMSEDLLKRLDPTEGDSPAAASHQLCLSEVRKKVEAACGQMEVNARLGVGSRVAVEFPRIDIFAQAVVRSPRSPRIRVAKPAISSASSSASQHA